MEKGIEHKRQANNEQEHIPFRNRKIHSEDIVDIIGSPPNGLVRWGVTWILVVLVVVVVSTAFIRYPDLIRAPLRINAANAPKAVIARMSGNIVNILVEAGETVAPGQPLAWIESTADCDQVLNLLERLQNLQDSVLIPYAKLDPSIIAPAGFRLGELQGSYQTFYQSYLTYTATLEEGIFLKRKSYILSELENVEDQRELLVRQRKLQEQEYTLAEKVFNHYDELAKRNIISPFEYQQQHALLLSKKHPLQLTTAALLDNDARKTAAMRELADLDHQISEKKAKFIQALNSMVSDIENWKLQHVLSSSQKGTLVYASAIHRNQHINIGQEVFYIDPGGSDFFGEINVPQFNMGKVQVGQRVLIKLNSYPFEEYGVLHGRIVQLNEVPYRDSVFLSKVDILPTTNAKIFRLTTGLVGTAEIITEDASLLQRFVRNIRLMVNKRN